MRVPPSRPCVRALQACGAALLLLLALAAGAKAAQPFTGGRWVLLSDVHFNPYADPALVPQLVAAPATGWGAVFRRAPAPPSAYFSDTNYALLESALDEMRRREPDPPVVVITGDFLGHSFDDTFKKLEPQEPGATYDAFVDKTIAFLAAEFDARFPRAQFVIVVGNNDGYCGDYRSTPGSPFLANMARAWEPLVDRGGAAPDFARTFPQGGYYTATLPAAIPLKAVAINSVFWSIAYDNACGVAGSDPGAAELAWLNADATAPAGGKRWLVMHIPARIDAYNSLRASLPLGFVRDAPESGFFDAAFAGAQQTAAIVAGHTHHPSFPLYARGSAAIGGVILPSISPVQGNNPAFELADVDRESGAIVSTATYAMLASAPAPLWTREYDTRGVYGIAPLDARGVAALQSKLGADPKLRAAFAAYYTSFSLYGGIPPASWRWYWCANDALTAVQYAACTGPPPAR
jgi:sphingomyelin phosphodiesterase acid-like 3